jgi:predicted ATPase/DNA-binding winged helix-turn-helix (wHTH) protein
MGACLQSDFLADSIPLECGEAVLFGPFRLYPGERRLERAGAIIPLGSRALDVLLVLIERAGEVVERRVLIARAWRNIVVDESNLRVTIANLRKVLGEGEAGTQYVQNVPGIGYCFVGQLTRESAAIRSVAPLSDTSGIVPVQRPAPGPAGVFGRDDTIRSLASTLSRQRLISIVGPGGIGKTTAAIALTNTIGTSFAPEIYFADLSDLTDGAMIARTLMYRFGLRDTSDDPAADLAQYLGSRRALVLLDNCEHIVDDVAMLTERIMSISSETHFIVTSREALRIKGEYVYRLSALATPPATIAVSLDEAAQYAAVELFIERARASGASFEYTEKSWASISKICRGLDGIPLAIEVAAARIGTFGLAGTCSLMGTRSRLQWRGRRNAPARHRNLEASIEWSHRLLSETEQLVFRRLSSFEQPATLDAVLAVAAHRVAEQPEAMEALEGLVAKHLLLVVQGQDDLPRYRLLESERIFAQEQLRKAEVD